LLKKNSMKEEKEEDLPKAYKIDEIFITKIYPCEVNYVIVSNINISETNTKKNYCLYPIYLMCFPCLITNICINISGNICKCICKL